MLLGIWKQVCELSRVGRLTAKQSSEPCWEWPVTRCVVLCSRPEVHITLPRGTGIGLNGLPWRSSTGGDSAGQNPGTHWRPQHFGDIHGKAPSELLSYTHRPRGVLPLEAQAAAWEQQGREHILCLGAHPHSWKGRSAAANHRVSQSWAGPRPGCR